MTPESDRPLGAAVIVGLARGAVAGTLLAVLPALILVQPPFSFGIDRLVLGWLGIVLAVSSLAVADDLEARLGSPWAKAFVRFLGGFAAPGLLVCPQLSMTGEASPLSAATLDWDHVVSLASVGMSLGLGQVGAGSSVRGVSRVVGWRRAFRSALVTGLCLGFALHGHDLAERLATGFVASFAVMALLAVASGIAEPVAHEVALWLEPEANHSAFFDPGQIHARELDQARVAWAKAKRTGFKDLLEKALGHARAARAAAFAGGILEIPPHETSQLEVEFLLALGRLDEAEAILDRLPQRAPIEAEIARLRGDAAGAIDRSSPGLAALAGTEDLIQRSVLASHRAVLALAEADRGNLEAARVHLERAREIPDTVERVLERLSVPAVEAALTRRKA